MGDAFKWLSPLGVSVGLFIAIGVLWILIGALTVPLHGRWGATSVFVARAPDAAYFGGDPTELLAKGSALAKLRTLLPTVTAGFLSLAGVVFASTAWFGLKEGHFWALATLGVVGTLAAALWALAVSDYVKAGVPLSIGVTPPFMWVLAVLMAPAIVLGWLGLR